MVNRQLDENSDLLIFTFHINDVQMFSTLKVVILLFICISTTIMSLLQHYFCEVYISELVLIEPNQQYVKYWTASRSLEFWLHMYTTARPYTQKCLHA